MTLKRRVLKDKIDDSDNLLFSTFALRNLVWSGGIFAYKLPPALGIPEQKLDPSLYGRNYWCSDSEKKNGEKMETARSD